MHSMKLHFSFVCSVVISGLRLQDPMTFLRLRIDLLNLLCIRIQHLALDALLDEFLLFYQAIVQVLLGCGFHLLLIFLMLQIRIIRIRLKPHRRAALLLAPNLPWLFNRLA